MISRRKKYSPPEILSVAVVMREPSLVASYVVYETTALIEGQNVDGVYEDADLTFEWSWE